MIAAGATLFREAVQQKDGREKLPLWYVMRIVGNKSDLLVQAVLDEIQGAAASLPRKPLQTAADIRRAEAARKIVESISEDWPRYCTSVINRSSQHCHHPDAPLPTGEGSGERLSYLYPTAYLQKSDRQRSVRRISPLLAGYIFVKAPEELLVELVNRVPNFIFCYPRKLTGTAKTTQATATPLKRIIISDAEMDRFTDALEKSAPNRDIELITLDEARSQLAQGTEVTISGGLLDGLSGTLAQSDSHKQLLLTLGNSFVLNIRLKRGDKTRALAFK